MKSLFDLNRHRIKFGRNDPVAGALPIASNDNASTYTVMPMVVAISWVARQPFVRKALRSARLGECVG